MDLGNNRYHATELVVNNANYCTNAPNTDTHTVTIIINIFVEMTNNGINGHYFNKYGSLLENSNKTPKLDLNYNVSNT